MGLLILGLPAHGLLLVLLSADVDVRFLIAKIIESLEELFNLRVLVVLA